MRSLEDEGLKIAAELGHDPADPNVIKQVQADAASVRQELPGLDDEAILAQHGDSIRQLASQRYPVAKPAAAAAQAPGPTAPAAPAVPAVGAAYKSGLQAVNEQFSPEQQAQLLADQKRRNQITEAGRSIGLGFRVNASPAALAALEGDYRSQLAANAQPLQDWNTRKAEAVKQLEQQVKAGQLEQEDLKFQMAKIGFDQIQQEKRTAEELAKSQQDPNSLHSQSLRQIARSKFPKFAEKMGAAFEQLSYATLVKEMPGLEKQFEKEMDAIEKQAERASRERIAATEEAGRNARAALEERGRNARNAADNAAKGTSVSAAKQKLIEEQEGAVAGADRALEATAGMKALIKEGKLTESGLGESISNAQQYLGLDTDRRKADEQMKGYVDSLVGSLALIDPRAKGAPSNADIQGIKETLNNPRTTAAEKMRAAERAERIFTDMKRLNQGAPGTAAPSGGDGKVEVKGW